MSILLYEEDEGRITIESRDEHQLRVMAERITAISKYCGKCLGKQRIEKILLVELKHLTTRFSTDYQDSDQNDRL